MLSQTPYSFPLLAMAIGICLTAGWSVALLQSELPHRGEKRFDWRHVAVILCAGLGVWATHFIAMLAYRPDLLIAYDPSRTALSALISIIGVGIPCALLPRASHFPTRLTLAAIAGAGIWCMHAVGLTGMVHGHHHYSVATNVAGGMAGIAIMIGWQARTRWRRSRRISAFLFSISICATHFISLAGDTLVGSLTQPVQAVFAPGLVAACMAFAVSVACLASLLTMAQVHSTREKDARTRDAVIQSMSDGLVFIDESGRLRHFNRRFLTLFDTPAVDLAPGMTIAEFLDVVAFHRGWDANKRQLVGHAMAEWASTEVDFDRECEMEDGRTYLMQARSVGAQGVVLTFNDVTVERRAMTDLSYMAHHDALTGLGNRRALRERKLHMMARMAPFAMLLIDLDEFKQVNDTFGHGVGDKLLVHCATLLRELSDASHFVARMGGDEMAILVPGTYDGALAFAQIIVEQLSRSVTIDGCRITPGCSIGVSQWQEGMPIDDLMRRADMALYEAKRTGRRRWSRYEDHLADRLAQRQLIITGLHDALQHGGLSLAFQPIVALNSGLTTGYEALLRWHHPSLGWVSPTLFIPIAEEGGLIDDIGRWVIAEACRQAAGWSEHLQVAVNVSAIQLCSDSLPHYLAQAIVANGLTPDRLEIEITETALMLDPARVASCLERVRALGIRIALDDFGTGYSSLAHLRDFPFDRLKIDRSFVASAADDARAMAILRCTIAIGRELGVITHAEGVETREHVDLLAAIGCDVVQGYYVGRPIIPNDHAVIAEVSPQLECVQAA